MTPRPYQLEAIEALDDALATRDDNPCIVLPTGAGKTPTMAWTFQRHLQYPDTRIMMVTHIKELLVQGVEKMRAIWPAAPIGVYSAGLGSRDIGYSLTYAGIQSIYKKGLQLPRVDLLHIDEAHRIPLGEEGQYRQFIADLKLNNPGLRVIGWTATDYRLAGGNICGRDYILNHVAYEASVKTLIDDGYLCKLRSKTTVQQVSTAGVGMTGKDYNQKRLGASAEKGTAAIVAEAVRILDAENRNSVIFFCVTVEHSEQFSAALAEHGFHAPTIHQGTPAQERAARAEAFKRGEIRGLVNVNVLSEGFDAQRVDAVVMVRPTASKGLYYQQVGRGLRTHPSKADCLVLDFSGNIARHGPIDALEGSRPVLRTCPECRETFPAVLTRCRCGWEAPPPEPTKSRDGEGAERIIPDNPAGRIEAPILSDSEPWEMEVESCYASLHKKADKPASIRIDYHGPGGMERYSEWICLGHQGYARTKARQWWRGLFGEPIPETAEEALTADMFFGDTVKEKICRIKLRKNGKYNEIIGRTIRNAPLAVAH